MPTAEEGTEPTIEVTNLDTSKLGAQTAHVKYTAGGKTVETDVKVTVVPVDFAVIGEKTVDQGTDLDAKELLSSEGTYKNFVLTDYDKTKPGVQNVTVTGEDTDGNTVSKTVPVTVEAKAFTLVDFKTVDQGTELTGDDLVKDAGDYKGFTLSDYDATKPGAQTVTVTGTDNAGNKVSKTVPVTVAPVEFNVIESYKVYQGTELDPSVLLASNGDYSNFTISGYDPNKVGVQTVTVTGEDTDGNKVSKTVEVTVVAADVKDAAAEDNTKTLVKIVKKKVLAQTGAMSQSILFAAFMLSITGLAISLIRKNQTK